MPWSVGQHVKLTREALKDSWLTREVGWRPTTVGIIEKARIDSHKQQVYDIRISSHQGCPVAQHKLQLTSEPLSHPSLIPKGFQTGEWVQINADGWKDGGNWYGEQGVSRRSVGKIQKVFMNGITQTFHVLYEPPQVPEACLIPMPHWNAERASAPSYAKPAPAKSAFATKSLESSLPKHPHTLKKQDSRMDFGQDEMLSTGIMPHTS